MSYRAGFIITTEEELNKDTSIIPGTFYMTEKDLYFDLLSDRVKICTESLKKKEDNDNA